MNARLGSIPVFWIRIAGYQMWYPEVWFRSRKGVGVQQCQKRRLLSSSNR